MPVEHGDNHGHHDVRAAVGDWLVAHPPSGQARRAVILSVHANGEPPYQVRWLDTGREALVVPGPGDEVFSAVRQAEFDRQRTERALRVQQEIAQQRHD